MNATWLVGTLVAALFAAVATIAVALFRFTKRSPEQREQDTAAFSAVTTGQGQLNADQAEWISYLNGEITALRQRTKALEDADAVKNTTIAEQTRTIASQADRIAVLERTLRENHIEIPPTS